LSCRLIMACVVLKTTRTYGMNRQRLRRKPKPRQK
jgi:hypothetical protein